VTYRSRTFLVALISSVVAVGVAVALISAGTRQLMLDETADRLVQQARLAAAILASRALNAPQAEAVSLAAATDARVTLIAADGRVIGDSDVAAGTIPSLDNHAAREEVAGAWATGAGVAVRHSQTTGLDTMYAAVPVEQGPAAIVRVALPLTRIEAQTALVRRLALVGLGAGLAVALLVTWIASAVLSRRVQAVAAVAERYRRGDFSQPPRGYGRDEIGRVAGALDAASRELGRRLHEMARERAHTDAILEGMGEGVVLINAAGRLVLTNPAVRSMLRLPEPAADRPYLEVVRDPAITAQVSRALAGERTPPVEVQLDGDQRRIYVANVVPVPAARGGGAVLVLHDVTDIRRADQARRDFVANVSHELRTPLTAVRGYVEALTDEADRDQQRRFLEIIMRHTLRMERLVRDLLRLARLDAGQEALERTSCSVSATTAAVVHEMQVQLSARRQDVALDLADDATHVPADPAKLHDVLRNLVENASHYGPEGSTIDVRSRRDGDAVVLIVADRGPGIPEAERLRIFERFYRVDRSRARDPGGTGLGLSIVRHLVELHGGQVAARPRDGGGAELVVRLPARSDVAR
jgi:two-component system phosphate regulon sensor histidine kinase PhoR